MQVGNPRTDTYFLSKVAVIATKTTHCQHIFSRIYCSRLPRKWGSNSWTSAHKHVNSFIIWTTIRNGFVSNEMTHYSLLSPVVNRALSHLRKRFHNNHTLFFEWRQLINWKLHVQGLRTKSRLLTYFQQIPSNLRPKFDCLQLPKLYL